MQSGTPSPASNWASATAPATDFKVVQASDLSEHPIATGTAVLVGGTKAVSDARVTANTIIRLSHKTIGGTPGAVYVSAKSVGTSFTITSTGGSDTSTIYYEILSY